jgi:hypothetical protein
MMRNYAFQDLWRQSMHNLGIFISNERLIMGTFMDGDSDAVGIMMHASGASSCKTFCSDVKSALCNPDKVHCPTKMVDEESK